MTKPNRTLILGNSGSGKTTLARAIAEKLDAAYLSMDAVAFSTGATRAPLLDSVAQVRKFYAQYPRSVLEGCYATIASAVLAREDRLVFLNPGTQTCIEHCRVRPWEPDKYASSDEQQAMFDSLLQWVSTYEVRDDEYGLKAHRALYEAFTGTKLELTDPTEYDAAVGLSRTAGPAPGLER